MATLALNRILVLALMDLDRRAKSACVTVHAGKARRIVHVQQGHIVGADSNLKSERIGEMLAREGRLDAALVEPTAAEALRARVRVGEVLVRDGLLSADELAGALEKQVSFRLGATLTMRGLITIDAPRPVKPTLELRLNTALTAAFRTSVPLAAIEDHLKLVAELHEAPQNIPEDVAQVLANLELGPAELKISQRLVAGEALDDLLASGMPREPVLRLAGALHVVGLLR